MSKEIVAKAKADLETAGHEWKTICDAYAITNLAAKRAGWKLVQKTSGDNCQGRKVDGVIPGDGNWYDVLINAGPPLNQNIPAFNLQGPVGNLIGVEPFDWADPTNTPVPSPVPIPEPSSKLEERVAALEQLMDKVIHELSDLGTAEYAVILPIERLPNNMRMNQLEEKEDA